MRMFRWVGAVGALLYSVGFVLVSSVPGGGGDIKAGDFAKFYVTDDRSGSVVVGMFILTFGVLALLWFFHTLRWAAASPDAAFGASTASLGLVIILVGAGVLSGPSGALAFSDLGFVGRPVAHALAQSGFALMLVPGSLSLALGVAVLAVAGRRARVMAPWVATVGLVAAALQLLAFIWIPSFAIPIWIFIASLAGLTVPDRAQTAGSPEAVRV